MAIYFKYFVLVLLVILVEAIVGYCAYIDNFDGSSELHRNFVMTPDSKLTCNVEPENDQIETGDDCKMSYYFSVIQRDIDYIGILDKPIKQGEKGNYDETECESNSGCQSYQSYNSTIILTNKKMVMLPVHLYEFRYSEYSSNIVGSFGDSSLLCSTDSEVENEIGNCEIKLSGTIWWNKIFCLDDLDLFSGSICSPNIEDLKETVQIIFKKSTFDESNLNVLYLEELQNKLLIYETSCFDNLLNDKSMLVLAMNKDYNCRLDLPSVSNTRIVSKRSIKTRVMDMSTLSKTMMQNLDIIYTPAVIKPEDELTIMTVEPMKNALLDQSSRRLGETVMLPVSARSKNGPVDMIPRHGSTPDIGNIIGFIFGMFFIIAIVTIAIVLVAFGIYKIVTYKSKGKNPSTQLNSKDNMKYKELASSSSSNIL